MFIYHKVCCKCKLSKPHHEFHKDKTRKDGLTSACKYCHKQYRESNKQRSSVYLKKYRQEHKEYYSEYNKKYREDNKDKLNEYIKEWRISNPSWNKEYIKNRKQKDPMFKFIHSIRSLISVSLRKGGYTKKSKTFQILGCSFSEFVEHIESQFTEGMSWDNRDRWHLDHITPVSWGKTEEEVITLNHHTNFQPLWAEINLKKNNKYSG